MSSRNLRRSIISIPVVGYLVRIVNNVAGLPKLHDRFIQNQERTATLLASLETANQKTVEQNAKLARSIQNLQLAQDNLQGQFGLLETTRSAKPATVSKKSSDKELFADDHIMDNFYGSLEDRFRGSEDIISKRLEEYLPYFLDSKINFAKTPVLDIGSGRGELLQLLKKNKVSAIGLDINHDMVKRSNEKSLKAVHGDALTYLQAADSQSYGAITGFHLVEHIPFNVLLRIFKAAHRSLVTGGFVIFETPNPENLTVGSHTFYMDPSHLHPLPPALLAFALETCGFKDIEIKRLHPDTEKKRSNLDKEVAGLLFGPRDYAAIGYK